MVHGIREAHARSDHGAGVRLWGWSRTTVWRNVCDVMDDADLSGLHASPKGLRHGVGDAAVQAGIGSLQETENILR